MMCRYLLKNCKQLRSLYHGLKVAIVLLGSLFLSACASTIGTHINAFSASDKDLKEGSRIAIAPGDGVDADSLEFKLYKEKVTRALGIQGYLVSESQSAENILYLSYDVDRIEDDESNIRTSYIINSHSRRRSGFGANFVFFGGGGSDVPNYLRTLSFKIDQRSEGDSKRLYEMTASSEGRCSVMSEVFDEMLEAVMKGFPSGDGKLYYVKVKADTNCRY